MMFCKIAQAFNDSQGSLRVPSFTLSCKIGMVSTTPEDRYATPSLGSPALKHFGDIKFFKKSIYNILLINTVFTLTSGLIL